MRLKRLQRRFSGKIRKYIEGKEGFFPRATCISGQNCITKRARRSKSAIGRIGSNETPGVGFATSSAVCCRSPAPRRARANLAGERCPEISSPRVFESFREFACRACCRIAIHHGESPGAAGRRVSAGAGIPCLNSALFFVLASGNSIRTGMMSRIKSSSALGRDSEMPEEAFCFVGLVTPHVATA